MDTNTELNTLREQLRQLTDAMNEISLQNQVLLLENAKLTEENKRLDYYLNSSCWRAYDERQKKRNFYTHPVTTPTNSQIQSETIPLSRYYPSIP
jgi:regulator of replication initiation timing